MEARAKQDGPLYPVTAFGGRHYSQRDWRPVPEGREEEARSHPLLDVREPGQESGQGDLPSEPAEVDATDAARELAQQHSIDLAAVEGSGIGGRVLVSDVRAQIEGNA